MTTRGDLTTFSYNKCKLLENLAGDFESNLIAVQRCLFFLFFLFFYEQFIEEFTCHNILCLCYRTTMLFFNKL